jgi:membrane protease subunit (stomatin/prohibitin family)
MPKGHQMPKAKKQSLWAEVRSEMKKSRQASSAPSGWDCARCGTGNAANASQCGCGADARLAAIRY